ncbi:MAG: nucleotide exchange factor GrpE [Hyphomicrobiaceae bacterium]|nr:nucleotide exchange factor GrpE [Hyphomicrobiaceae bacterium]
MSDNGTQGQPAEGQPAGGVEPGAGAAPAAPAAAAGTQPEAERSVHDVIAALQAEASDFKDKWLRAHAEIDNVRKRLEREKEETAKYAVTKFARDIVGVADNFQRAIGAVPQQAAEQDAALKSFLEGVVMTEREFLNVLERYGIRRIDPANEPFNPHQHQAVMEIERADVAAGTVVQVFQAGYMIEERVLRPAMVAVAKGGPKAAAAPQAQPEVPPA